MQDIKFSNGVTIPTGTVIAAAVIPTHMDDENYAHAGVFDPWRFSDMRHEDEESSKYQFASSSADYMAFGYGKHAW